MDIIELNRVEKRFDKPVLRDITFSVRPGEILGFLGPNGAGKTTTVRLIAGVSRLDGGEIRVAGYDPVHDGDAIRRRIGVLTESASLYGHMSALENLRFFAELYGVDESERPAQLLTAFGLAADAGRRVATYSTGMKKRLALARALLHRPEVLFLDEPTSGLDPDGIRLVLEYIADLNKREGTTVIVCSHVLPQLETICDRYVFIAGGRTIAAGTLTELETRYSGQVLVRVETDLKLAGESYHGLPARRVDSGAVEFGLAKREQMPELLGMIQQEAAVYGSMVVNRDLESLYFRIEEAAGHEN